MATMPDHSWPRMAPGLAYCSRTICRSEPQMPHSAISTSTSPGPGSGQGTCSRAILRRLHKRLPASVVRARRKHSAPPPASASDSDVGQVRIRMPNADFVVGLMPLFELMTRRHHLLALDIDRGGQCEQRRPPVQLFSTRNAPVSIPAGGPDVEGWKPGKSPVGCGSARHPPSGALFRGTG